MRDAIRMPTVYRAACAILVPLALAACQTTGPMLEGRSPGSRTVPMAPAPASTADGRARRTRGHAPIRVGFKEAVVLVNGHYGGGVPSTHRSSRTEGASC